jgi:3-oxoacyl-[acyl-carrier protein] reductase
VSKSEQAPWALITGATSPIGVSLAQLLGADGWGLILLGRDPERLAEVRGALGGAAPRVRVHAADLRRLTPGQDLPAVPPGGLRGLVHLAGVAYADRLDRTTADEAQQMWRVHVWSAHQLVAHYRPALAQTGGSVVLVGSVDALAAPAAEPAAAYAASKGGLVALGRALAVELGPEGIRVNSVLPGALRTGMGQALVGAAAHLGTRLKRRIPLRRLGQPEEIAQVIRFLLGEGASYLTGQALVVDGGLTAGY